MEESGADSLASSGLIIINLDLTEAQLIHNHICAGGVNVTLPCFTRQGLLSRLPASNGENVAKYSLLSENYNLEEPICLSFKRMSLDYGRKPE